MVIAMNRKQVLLTLIAVDFLALNAWVIAEHGYLGTFATIFATMPGILVSIDLLLALSMVMAWMWTDARKHGLTVTPYLLVTLALGSLGPLAYLVRREWSLVPRR